MPSCIYEGWVRHRRFAPTEHQFQYALFMVCLDLAEIETVFQGRWLWSTKKPNLAWWRRADHSGKSTEDLRQSIADLVESRTGKRPQGMIHLLTHLRYFGYGFNPVSFYFCYNLEGTKVETVVAEVNNTPWGERHCYVLGEKSNTASDGRHRHRFAKAFHVSPFMAMAQEYDWQFAASGESLNIHMDNLQDGRVLFDSTMHLEKRPMTGRVLARVLVQYPFITLKVILAIHFQALLLWLKKVPVHPHPKSQTTHS